MTLVIEDGSGVTGANSYVSYDDAKAFCDLRGYTIGPDQAAGEIALIKSCDYLEAQRNRYQGRKTNDPDVFVSPEQQPLQWPRTGVYIDAKAYISFQVVNGFENLSLMGFLNMPFPPDEIPAELINAQIMLAVNVQAGIILQPTQSGPFVTFKKVGTLEKHFSEILNTSVEPDMLAVNDWLQPLLINSSGAMLSSVRV